MYRKYKRELEKYVEKREKENKDFISFVLDANFDILQHNMLLEKDFDCSEIYLELSDLEKADLIDYLYMEKNGTANKKRRNILC